MNGKTMGWLVGVIAGLLILGVSLGVCRHNAQSVSFWKGKNKKNHDKLLEIIDIFHQYMTRNNLTYWMHCGTLLGAVRHAGFIPWDDDADFAIPVHPSIQTDQQLDLVMNEMASHTRFKVQKHKMGYQIVHPSGQTHIDLFLFLLRPEENQKSKNTTQTTQMRWEANQWSQSRWPKEYYLADEVFPLQKIEFEGRWLWAPQDPWTFLRRMAGSDVFLYGKITHFHEMSWLKIGLYILATQGLSIPMPIESIKRAKSFKPRVVTGCMV